MKPVRCRFTAEARTLIRKLPPQAKAPIRALIDEISQDPFSGKELKDKLQGFRSVRYTHYRVIYDYDEKAGITIHTVGERKNVYRLFESLMRSMKG